MVIEHQQNSGDEQNDKKDERNRAEIIGSTDTKRFLADFNRHPVEEEIPENRQAARAVGIGRPAAEDGLPHFGFAKVLQRGLKTGGHHSLRPSKPAKA